MCPQSLVAVRRDRGLVLLDVGKVFLLDEVSQRPGDRRAVLSISFGQFALDEVLDISPRLDRVRLVRELYTGFLAAGRCANVIP